MNDKTASYGESAFYEGKTGAVYFAGQNKYARLGAKLESRKFKKFVGPEDTVLDFGCAGGWMLRELAPKRKVGVELNPLAHPVCRRNGVEVHRTVEGAGEEKFSRIISHHVLEHVPYPIEALKSLKERLQDDGLMILVVPIDDWRAQKDFTGKDPDHHLHTWTPRLFANTLVEAGLRPQQIRVLSRAWPKGYRILSKVLPLPLFDVLSWLSAHLVKRHQLVAVVEKAPPQVAGSSPA